MPAQPARRPPPSRRPRPSRHAPQSRHPAQSRQPPPSRRQAPAPHRQRARQDQAARLEQRRRRRHLQQLRRDALVDLAVAFGLMIALVIVTAGLGVIALLEIPVTAIVVGSFLLERRRARTAAANRPRRRQ